MRFGDLPEDLGLVDLSPKEMMFWMYCPVVTPSEGMMLPDNLEQFRPILDRVSQRDSWEDKYVYLTAKTLFVSGANVGNRPGWHSDGFGTDDVNYIWYDRCHTQFVEGEFHLSEDHDKSMVEMDLLANKRKIVTFPEKHLLRLTPAVIHRSPPRVWPGMRTFVKVSISTERYNLEGNSINHLFTEQWDMVPRRAERNHPVGETL